MVPNPLIDYAQTAALPAPHWFIQFFKVLGFTLHAVPMNLWYAGLLLAVWLHLNQNQQGRRFAARLISQMPVIIALGVNLGVVPLLFIQLAYFRFFYPATILMAWPWIAIIMLLIPAYYGVYAYAWGLRNVEMGMAPVYHNGLANALHKLYLPAWRQAAGWIAAFLFIVIGFIFANGLSLMDHVGRWEEIWSNNNVAGAASGTGINLGDPTLWPRWLLMFGLALGTTAVWLLVDMAFFFVNADDDYKLWAWSFAKKLYTVSMVWTGVAGMWYVFGTWSAEILKSMFAWPMVVLTVLTALAPGLPWIMIFAEKRVSAELAGVSPAKRTLVAGIALAQLGVLAINAISRQVVQNLNIGLAFDFFGQNVETQWGPMLMFLIVFLLGLAVLAWMIAQVIKSAPKTSN
jgi:hypothetical protein